MMWHLPHSGSDALALYESCLAQRPLLTKQVSGGLIMAAADALVSKLNGGAIDPRSLLKMSFLQVFLKTPIMHAWHGSLAAHTRRMPEGARKVAYMAFLDTVVLRPALNVLFLTAAAVLDGKSFA